MHMHKLTGLTSRHKKFGKIEEISGEVRYADSLKEAVEFAGNERNVVQIINHSTARNVRQALYSRGVNSPDDDTLERFHADAAKIFELANPASGRIGPTVDALRTFSSKFREIAAGGEPTEKAMRRVFELARELGVV